MDLVVDGVIYEYQARGGISRLFTELLPTMCAQEPDLHVRLRAIEIFLQQPLPTHPRIRPVGARRLRPARAVDAVAPWLQAQARAGLPSRAIWHSTYYTLPLVWSGPRVVSAYDTIHLRYADLWSGAAEDAFRARQRRVVRAADAVVCISETTRRDLIERCGADPDRLHVVHLSHTPVFGPRPEAARPDRPFVLYVGQRTAVYKGFGTVLEAVARWTRAHEVGLTVVGPPWTADEDADLDRLGIRDRVRLLGDVDDEALADLYATAEAFVYPSLYEGFGIPLLEAMACQCPVVASRIPTTEEIAGDVPFFFEPADADGLVDALDRALAEGRGGPHVPLGEARAATFSWDRAAAETLAVYRGL